MKWYLIQKADEENRQTAVADVVQRDEPVFICSLQKHNIHFFKNKIHSKCMCWEFNVRLGTDTLYFHISHNFHLFFGQMFTAL